MAESLQRQRRRKLRSRWLGTKKSSQLSVPNNVSGRLSRPDFFSGQFSGLTRYEACHLYFWAHGFGGRGVICDHWPISIIMNSAGFSGAIPITHTSRPASRSSCVIVLASHLTKKASRGVEPCRAPCCQSFRRNFSIVELSAAHNGGPLGSKTAHCVPA